MQSSPPETLRFSHNAFLVFVESNRIEGQLDEFNRNQKNERAQQREKRRQNPSLPLKRAIEQLIDEHGEQRDRPENFHQVQRYPHNRFPLVFLDSQLDPHANLGFRQIRRIQNDHNPATEHEQPTDRRHRAQYPDLSEGQRIEAATKHDRSRHEQPSCDKDLLRRPGKANGGANASHHRMNKLILCPRLPNFEHLIR
jgi:hypothetical protein